MSNLVSYSQLKRIYDELANGRGFARCNHSDWDNNCDGSSKSVHISEVKNDGLGWYCFRCNQHGMAYPPLAARKQAGKAVDATTPKRTGATCRYISTQGKWNTIRSEGVSVPSNWSGYALQWTLQYLKETSKLDSLGGVEYGNRLWMPLHSLEGTVVAISGRLLWGNGPKYINYRLYENKFWWPITYTHENDKVVLVEDVMSAHVLALNEHMALPLLGVYPGQKLYKHIEGFQWDIEVWLDWDSLTVKRAARRLAERLRNSGKRVTINKLGDPKKVLT